MGKTPCCNKADLKRGKWSAEEDKKLIDYINVHGEGHWRFLPSNAGLLRCGKSCRLRWLNYLRSDKKRGKFTEEEDEIISQLHKIMGSKWSMIAKHLPGRTDNDIKNYWNSHLSRKQWRYWPRRMPSYGHYQGNMITNKAATTSEEGIITIEGTSFEDFFSGLELPLQQQPVEDGGSQLTANEEGDGKKLMKNKGSSCSNVENIDEFTVFPNEELEFVGKFGFLSPFQTFFDDEEVDFGAREEKEEAVELWSNEDTPN